MSKSPRSSSAIIKDILKAISHLQAYTSDLTMESFSTNFMAVEACLYNIQIIGEAASKISPDIKRKAPNVPWLLIKGMRNRLVHEYFGTDLEVVWGVIKTDLPILKIELEKLLEDLELGS